MAFDALRLRNIIQLVGILGMLLSAEPGLKLIMRVTGSIPLGHDGVCSTTSTSNKDGSC